MTLAQRLFALRYNRRALVALAIIAALLFLMAACGDEWKLP